MDQRQKELLSLALPHLAVTINFSEVAELLQLAKLITKEKVEEIAAHSESSFTRNLRLINALEESKSLTAFDDFVSILESINNQEALRLISPESLNRQPTPIASRDMLAKFADKFSKFSSQKYPLGMNSGLADVSQTSSNYSSPTIQHLTSSPLKEKHQATLISSGNNNKSPSYRIGNRHGSIDGSDFISNNRTAANLGTTTTTPPTSNSGNITGSGLFKLRGLRPDFIAQSSQTPTRAALTSQELPLINNLSMLDEGEASNDEEEPIVCWHPYARSADSSRASSPHRCHPSYASSESDSSSESLILDPNLILDSNVTMAIAKEGTNMMTVKLATNCHNNPEEDYKMTARPRGPCLIVNNIDFEGDMFPTRKGSDEDARRFDDIFQQLGFTVFMRRNQTADEMRKLFVDVAAECKPEHDALFVFILSHGSEHGIYGTDGMEVYLESEIISCFDNRNCKAMLGKPKVFVIQACRGRSKDCGGSGDTTDSVAWPSVMASPSIRTASQENRVPASWLPSTQVLDGKKRKHPIRTDMLLIFSCLAGFVSVRNELAGSWLGVALAYFIMTHAHERDLMRILNLVTSDVIQRESSNGHIQSIELKLLGWTKNLYFNPGIYL